MGSTWELIEAITGFTSIKAPDSLSQSLAYSSSTYNRLRYQQFTINAAADTTLDLYSWTDAYNVARTATKLTAMLIKVTGNTGVLVIEPGASNPLSWFMAGTAPTLTLTPTTSPAMVLLARPGAFTVSNTAKNLKFSNTGAATVTVTAAFVLGD